MSVPMCLQAIPFYREPIHRHPPFSRAHTARRREFSPDDENAEICIPESRCCHLPERLPLRLASPLIRAIETNAP